jgi:hypothetical protein
MKFVSNKIKFFVKTLHYDDVDDYDIFEFLNVFSWKMYLG